jgi:hypothetical protein
MALFAGLRILKPAPEPETDAAAGTPPQADPGYLYGRITLGSGDSYEGRLRFGGSQEAFWGDYFNGSRVENPWAAFVPPEQLLQESRPFTIFGIEIMKRQDPIDLGRQFMARLGDITRIELGSNVRVTLKSGTVFDLDYYSANDFDDGVRVWDARQGVIDLGQGDLDFGPLGIKVIELLAASQTGAAPNRLHGTVRTRQGDFAGFIQWNRNKGVGSDTLDGRAADGDLSLRFDTMRSLARHSENSSRVTLLDGREIVLSDETGADNLGIYVDDRRYGRVLVSWGAFERLDFSPGGSGPAYGDFPPGVPLEGSVITRAGRRLAGRLIYDLDESETTETLDASSNGVDYNIPFGLIASIVLPGPENIGARRAKVTLHSNEVLEFELNGDLSERNAGMLIFTSDNARQPEYVRWTEMQQIHLDRPSAMYPPLAHEENESSPSTLRE